MFGLLKGFLARQLIRLVCAVVLAVLAYQYALHPSWHPHFTASWFPILGLVAAIAVVLGMVLWTRSNPTDVRIAATVLVAVVLTATVTLLVALHEVHFAILSLVKLLVLVVVALVLLAGIMFESSRPWGLVASWYARYNTPRPPKPRGTTRSTRTASRDVGLDSLPGGDDSVPESEPRHWSPEPQSRVAPSAAPTSHRPTPSTGRIRGAVTRIGEKAS